MPDTLVLQEGSTQNVRATAQHILPHFLQFPGCIVAQKGEEWFHANEALTHLFRDMAEVGANLGASEG